MDKVTVRTKIACFLNYFYTESDWKQTKSYLNEKKKIVCESLRKLSNVNWLEIYTSSRKTLSLLNVNANSLKNFKRKFWDSIYRISW